MRAVCVVPASSVTQEEIETLLAQAAVFDRLVVVDNGADELSLKSIPVTGSTSLSSIRFNSPLGKAEALRIGLRVLMDESNYSAFAQLDVHDKQPAWQVKSLIERLKQTGADLVVGNRYVTPLEEGSHRHGLMLLFCSMVRLSAGYRLSDCVCGMRVYSARCAAAFISESFTYGYGLELEQLFIAARNGWRTVEVGLQSRPQFNSTAAEKIIENLHVLVVYARKALDQRYIHEMLAQMKARRSFSIPGQWLSLDGPLTSNSLGQAKTVRIHIKLDMLQRHEMPYRCVELGT